MYLNYMPNARMKFQLLPLCIYALIHVHTYTYTYMNMDIHFPFCYAVGAYGHSEMDNI